MWLYQRVGPHFLPPSPILPPTALEHASWCLLCVFQALKCELWADGAPTQVEEDLWYDSFLSVSPYPLPPLPSTRLTSMFVQCYHRLTEWEELEKASVMYVHDGSPPQLNRVWEDDYRMVRK